MNSQLETWIADYISLQCRTLETIDSNATARAIETIRDAAEADRQIFVIGNGGSAANASHFVTDLGKGSSDKWSKRFRCLSLNDNTAWMSALGNDYSYDDIFVRQLMNYAGEGDILLGASVSGNSPNIVKAFEWANAHKLITIALVGGNKCKLAQIAQQTISVENTHYGRVEDAHMTIFHLFAYAFMESAIKEK